MFLYQDTISTSRIEKVSNLEFRATRLLQLRLLLKVNILHQGGCVWKVFKKEKKGLRHYWDAEQYCVYMLNKHKDPVGEFASWKNISGN